MKVVVGKSYNLRDDRSGGVLTVNACFLRSGNFYFNGPVTYRDGSTRDCESWSWNSAGEYFINGLRSSSSCDLVEIGCTAHGVAADCGLKTGHCMRCGTPIFYDTSGPVWCWVEDPQRRR